MDKLYCFHARTQKLPRLDSQSLQAARVFAFRRKTRLISRKVSKIFYEIGTQSQTRGDLDATTVLEQPGGNHLGHDDVLQRVWSYSLFGIGKRRLVEQRFNPDGNNVGPRFQQHIRK